MSFIFIPNLIAFEGELPYTLAKGYTLRRANRAEAEIIRKRLKELEPMVGSSLPYDRDFEGNSVSTKFLSEEIWFYWIIECSVEALDYFRIAKALALLKEQIDVGFAIVESDSMIRQVGYLFQFLGDFRRVGEHVPTQIKVDALSSVASYFDLIDSARIQQTSAHFALQQFLELRSLPPRSNHQILGCFAVIESLLTHNPNDKEVGDSLTHQLKTKLILLEKMFARPLDFSPFGVTDSAGKQNVWKCLYSYRSAIAHGNRFEFETKFKALKTRETALDFLREVTKLVILVALEKPDFINDLKAV